MNALRSKTTRYCWLLVATLALGCGNETIDHASGDAGATDGTRADAKAPPSAGDGAAGADTSIAGDGATTGGHKLRIYIVGDVAQEAIDDGASGQTPRRFVMGLGRFDIMKSPDDPAPFTVFDHADQPKMIDLLAGKTLAGEAAIADLPSGVYGFGRVLLTSAEATVDATVHLGVAVPGDLTVVGALSDTTIDGEPRKQNEARFRFEVGGVGQTVPGTLPPLPSTGGGSIVQQDGKTWMVFPFPKPFNLSPATARDHQSTITYQLFESFRWLDEQQPGYKPGVFDIDASSMAFETVVNFGATDYGVTSD